MPTLLVVDDEPVVRMLVCRALREAGYDCLEADSGLAAVRALQTEAQPIDAMVVDIQLPDLSGVDVVRLARQLRPGTPALYMSGYALPIIEEPELQESLQWFLAKPFRPDQLLSAVRELLSAPQQA
jgi:two-component system, cell cycle sensor histidine kinase and response regulator CckA